jgi:hypothetical protein
VIEKMQPHLPKFNLDDASNCSRNLNIIVELVEYLQSETLSLTEISEDDRKTVGFSEALIRSELISSQVSLPFE